MQSDLRAALLQRVRGIGPDRARRLLDAYGDNLDAVLSDSAAIPAIAATIDPGRREMGHRLAAMLVARWTDELAPEFAAMAWFDRHRITDQPWLARKIVRILGPRTQKTLESNPYVLAKSLAWAQMDAIGKMVLGQRIPGDGLLRAPQRVLGALDSVIGGLLTAGHTAVPIARAGALLAGNLGDDPDLVHFAGHLGEKHGRIIESGGIWRFTGCAHLEQEVIDRTGEMAHHPGRIAVDPLLVDKVLHEVAELLPRPLSDEQADAVRHALTHPFAVIAGGAGTGKTQTMQALVLAWEAMGGEVHLCALAGKAALRLSQTTHRLARTIHRTLAELAQRATAEAEGMAFPADLSKFGDGTLVIVDESSMVDLGQWARLLKAMPPGCRMVMVGDTAQLPPIGFGLVFHVLAARPDTARLTRIYRQEATSGIPVVAAAIRAQQVPVLTAFDGVADGVTIQDCGPNGIDDQVQHVIEQLGGFGQNGKLALHIVAATNKRVLTLNQRFHDLYRHADQPEVKGYLGAYFSRGDPVVHLTNDYKRGLFNGMVGTVVGVDARARSVTVSFDGESHEFDRDELGQLDLAYALTCHKLQGSQVERAVIVIERTRLLEPSWLYTAVTRAERQAVLVGPSVMLDTAVAREFAWQTRVVGIEAGD